jgi:hypothetical protein
MFWSKWNQLVRKLSDEILVTFQFFTKSFLMEQHTLKNVNNCWNTNISFYLETSGGQCSFLYLNVVHFFNIGVLLMSVAAEDSYFPA